MNSYVSIYAQNRIFGTVNKRKLSDPLPTKKKEKELKKSKKNMCTLLNTQKQIVQHKDDSRADHYLCTSKCLNLKKDLKG